MFVIKAFLIGFAFTMGLEVAIGLCIAIGKVFERSKK